MSKILIIAEAGVNHNGSIDIAKQLIEVASEAGADFVKFQTFKAEKLVSRTAKKADYQTKNSIDSDNSQLTMLKKLELSFDDHTLLIDYCKTKDIKFLSTAFDNESLDFLNSLNLEIFKIPSGEITNLPYLRKISSYKKPIILSTGMCNLAEIENAINVLEESGTQRDNITVLHCNTEYPTPMEDVNLNAMLTIRDAFNVNIGYSDHTEGIEVAIASVAMGAVCIEKHFTLDKSMEGPDHKASLNPGELKKMIQAIRNIEIALGDGLKKPSSSETKNINVARKSIHLAKNLPEGHVLTQADLIMKRPGNGISPMLMQKILGHKLLKSLEEDHQLSWKDLA